MGLAGWRGILGWRGCVRLRVSRKPRASGEKGRGRGPKQIVGDGGSRSRGCRIGHRGRLMDASIVSMRALLLLFGLVCLIQKSIGRSGAPSLCFALSINRPLVRRGPEGGL